MKEIDHSMKHRHCREYTIYAWLYQKTTNWLQMYYIRPPIVNSLFLVTCPDGKIWLHELSLITWYACLCIKIVLRSHVIRHVCGYYTGEMIGFMVYYRIQWNIVVSLPRSPKQNLVFHGQMLVREHIKKFAEICLLPIVWQILHLE